MGEFFDLHPGPERLAKAGLINDLKKQLCETPFLGPCDFRKVELGYAGRARAVLAAAALGRAPGALAAAVGAVTAAAVRHTPTESELLSFFAAHEELKGGAAQEWIAGALEPFGALAPDGAGGGLRGYGDVLLPASLCLAAELRRAASLDELRDQDGKPRAPESLHASYFTEPALRESDDLGTAFTVGRGAGPTPKAPPELKAPIRSVAAARKTGEWGGLGGWREAAEDEIERVFVHFGSTKVVPARTRRDAIGMHGKGKTHTYHLVVPCKEKRNSDGEVTRKKVRINAADLVSNSKTTRTFAAKLAAETSRLLT